MKRGLFLLFGVLSWACSSGPPRPTAIDTRNDLCAFCRMTISSTRTAAQLVAPGEEPRSFDDIGCLASFFEGKRDLPPGSAAYVVDFASGQWIEASAALYTKVPSLETPMGSHLVAHASEESRRQDPLTAGLPALSESVVFAAAAPPGGDS